MATVQSPRSRRRRYVGLGSVLVVLSTVLALAGCGAEEEGPHLDLSAALPDEVPDGTVLRVGDPQTQTALEESGLDEELGIEVEWANISGGPKTLEAFRADALDIGAVADIPPLFAQWTGTDIKIVAARDHRRPARPPDYELGVAPGVDVKDLDRPAGQEDRLQPGPGAGRARAAGAAEGRPDPGRRRARRADQRRRRRT